MKLKDIISEVWSVWVEQCKTRKALRILNKQEWSLEFLTTLIITAARKSGKEYEMTIVSPNGAHIVISTINKEPKKQIDDSIFNHLDDDIKVRQFIERLKNG